jgi:hypothetical protein
MKNQLTANERSVLIAADDAAIDATGGDFGFYDEITVPDGVKGRKGLGAVLGSLEAKGLLDMDRVRPNGQGPWLSQFVVTEAGVAAIKAIQTAEGASPEDLETPNDRDRARQTPQVAALQGMTPLGIPEKSVSESAPEPAPVAETDGQRAKRMAQVLGDLRHEIFTVRAHGDEPMRVAQDLLGTVQSILETRARNVV